MEVYFDNSATTRVLDEVKGPDGEAYDRGLRKSLCPPQKGNGGRAVCKKCRFPDRKDPEGKGKGKSSLPPAVRSPTIWL